jgi:hypothetical protein
MSDQAVLNPPPSPVELISQYVKLRDGKKQAEAVFEAWLQENFKTRMTEIEAQLLEKMRELGVQSLRGPDGTGTAYQKVTTSVTIADASEFRRHVIGSEQWDLTEWRASKTTIQELVEKGEAVPPGVNYTQFMTIGIRKN